MVEPVVGIIKSDSEEVPLLEFPTPDMKLFGQAGKINKGEPIRYIAQVKMTDQDGAIYRFGLVKRYQYTLIEGDDGQSRGPNIIQFEGKSIRITPRWVPITSGNSSSYVNQLR